eukprot:CAMPEP_0175922962 /NCGR_PEP_ID=MMETSP0108-20121206/14326_1 /TAXON_ID=195067 ORGANISM="Goniomonas pacifica, Strain CCMP1869" /NCGR_SAMPLE_ID=MMETSP0108 /ASSEMBLY_ACC=CAM_ASM_000204 /LENGTH=212 /DNA_ID=CAMNT_0017245949 /DNA_START=438 /DNA_END=1075 /DNA_ORIENTATION=-
MASETSPTLGDAQRVPDGAAGELEIQEERVAFVHEVEVSAPFGGDGGQARGHGFCERKAPALSMGGKHECVCCSVHGWNVCGREVRRRDVKAVAEFGGDSEVVEDGIDVTFRRCTHPFFGFDVKMDVVVAFTARGIYRGDDPLADQLSMYRQLARTPEAMLVSVTMAPTSSSLSSPHDAGMADLVFSPGVLDEINGEMDWVHVNSGMEALTC